MSSIQTEPPVAYQPGVQVWILHERESNNCSGSWRLGTIEEIFREDTSNSFKLRVRLEDHNHGGIIHLYDSSNCYLRSARDDLVDDLVKSDFLHEPGILQTLQVRYDVSEIYTYSGPILIAINPHKSVPHLYGLRMMESYKQQTLGDLAPHCYAIAEAAYTSMMADDQRQAILISGESGAGKTESAKLVMQYLAYRASNSSGSSTPIEEQVLESNPLLEAFGNAKTVRNDNSSRFGKWVEIDFDFTGRVSGASINTYLLERSRVTSLSKPERSYHIFYQLCAGASAEQRTDLGLEGGAQSFYYLSQSETYTLSDVDDARQFLKTTDAMSIIGLPQDTIQSVLQIVAGILHMGNIVFETNLTDEAVVSKSSTLHAQKTAQLFGVSVDGLLIALTTRAIHVRGEHIVKLLSAEEAAESRDSLAKTVYARLFDWIVGAVNKKIGMLGGSNRTTRTIGILDIYGFESFEKNSFEQLCINLANEHLQQQFNGQIFKGEQEEYQTEGIKWSYIEFIDNQDVLDLLEGTGSLLPTGIFPLIDEACRLPKATSQDLAHAIRKRLSSHPRFDAPQTSPSDFDIKHFAGKVCYSADYLMEKNRDFLVAEHASVMGESRLELMKALFHGEVSITQDELFAQSSGQSHQKKKSAFMLSSVGSRFRRQLGGLMNALSECQPFYIRCIKPNASSTPGDLSRYYVLEQLRAGGVLEAVRIACAGYPTRKPIMQFARRFTLLLPPSALVDLPLTHGKTVNWYSMTEDQLKHLTKQILDCQHLDDWQIGKTRVFLRTGQLGQLEGARSQLLTRCAIKIQTIYRGFLARRKFLVIQRSAKFIQAMWRAKLAWQECKRRQRERAAIRVQSTWRMYRCRRSYLQKCQARAAIVLQSYVRMWRTRRAFLRETELGRQMAAREAEWQSKNCAAIMLQKHWRSSLARTQLKKLKEEAFKVHMLSEQVRTLEMLVAQTHLEKEQAVRDLVSLRSQTEPLESAARQSNGETLAIASLEEELDVLRRKTQDDDRKAQLYILKLESALREKDEQLARAVQQSQQHFEGKLKLEEQIVHLESAFQAEVRQLSEALKFKDSALCESNGRLEEEMQKQQNLLGSNEALKLDLANVVQRAADVERLLKLAKEEAFLLTAKLATQDARSMASKKAQRLSRTPMSSAAGGAQGVHLVDVEEEQVNALIKSAVTRELPIAKVFFENSYTVVMPLSSWAIYNAFNGWKDMWKPSEKLSIAGKFLKARMLRAARHEPITSKARLLSMSLAVGVLFQYHSVAQWEEFVNCTELFRMFFESIAATFKVKISTLLSGDARRFARHSHQNFGVSLQDDPWKELGSQLLHLRDIFQASGMPSILIIEVLTATSEYIDCELLNSLLLRRDCCSISSAKSLKFGASSILATLNDACGAEFNVMLRCLQASQFLLMGKDDSTRKATRGVDILPDLRRSCGILSLQQIYRLTEYQHDDWIGEGGSSSIVLLEALRWLMKDTNENDSVLLVDSMDAFTRIDLRAAASKYVELSRLRISQEDVLQKIDKVCRDELAKIPNLNV